MNEKYKGKVRVKITDKFRKRLFESLFEKYSYKFLERELGSSHSTLYHYKNKVINTIPMNLLEKCMNLLGISKLELENNIIEKTSSKELQSKGLKIGREFRNSQLKQWQEEIPDVSEIINDDSLMIEKWFNSYRKLLDVGGREFKNISKNGNKLLLNYMNYSNGKKEKFSKYLPVKLKINEDFQYFFGLWCGDNIGGGRIGIGNKNLDLIYFTNSYLREIYQKPKLVLQKFSNFKEKPKINIKIDKVEVNKNYPGDYVFSLFSGNGILKSFFDYLLENLDEFLNLIPNKNIFFAGLFDADGNVLLEDECFRWSCKNMKEVEIYKKHLKELKLFHRYDGCNLVTHNKDSFEKLIYPYIKHKEKINKTNLICCENGYLDERFINILRTVKDYNGKTISTLSKKMGRKKLYAQIKVLEKLKYVKRENYPHKIFITEKGIDKLKNYKEG